tara:strand:+ start:315 stop:1577 length:1263 start_codon:yes stop_codon:yes gene_type:complete
MKQLITLLFLSFCFHGYAQENNFQTGDFIYGLSSGFNYTSLNIEQQNLSPTARPFMGLYGNYYVAEKWSLAGSGLLSAKASSYSIQTNIQQVGLDFNFFTQYKLDDLYFNSGFSLELPMRRSTNSVTKNLSANNQPEQSVVKNPKTQLNFLVGMEIQIVENWRLGANFILPIKEYNNRNFQLSVQYQINNNTNKPESERRIRKRITGKQIRNLRDGALLVRLKTSQPKIDALERLGFAQEAEEVRKQQRTENRSLMKTMKAYYNFSEVRFFYSNRSKAVRREKFDGIFVNDSLVEDSSIVLHNKKNIFTAEFAKLEEDTAKYFSHYEWRITGNFAMMRVPVYYGPGGHTFLALVVKDHNFKQLHRPFPFYSRAAFVAKKQHPDHGFFYLPINFFSPNSYKECVENLNNKLHRFYQKNSEK